MPQDCLFCKIVNGEVPSDKVYEDDQVIAFKDINPVAPVHILIIPRKHISTLNDLAPKDNELVGHIFGTAKTIAADLGFDEVGYRCVFNTNKHGGQVVFHIHLHLLAGKQFGWPPG
jgi:histidine triad (HIT) family protein